MSYVIKEMKAFIKDDSAVGVVEIILILVVLIALVLIFKNQLISLLKQIFGEIDSGASKIY